MYTLWVMVVLEIKTLTNGEPPLPNVIEPIPVTQSWNVASGSQTHFPMHLCEDTDLHGSVWMEGPLPGTSGLLGSHNTPHCGWP